MHAVNDRRSAFPDFCNVAPSVVEVFIFPLFHCEMSYPGLLLDFVLVLCSLVGRYSLLRLCC